MKLKIFIGITTLTAVVLLFFQQSEDFIKNKDSLYINGQIIGLESGSSKVEAMFVKSGKIEALGTNKYILEFQSDNVEIVDLHNQVVLPGFIDSHSHVALSSFFNDMVDLSGFTHTSNEEVWQHLAEAVQLKKPGEWIIGKGIDSVLVKDLQLPDIAFFG